jgi:hypothetical protein
MTIRSKKNTLMHAKPHATRKTSQGQCNKKYKGEKQNITHHNNEKWGRGGYFSLFTLR